MGQEMVRVPSGSVHLRRPASAQSNHAAHDMQMVSEEDYELIAEYIDAIRHLTAAAQAEKPDREEVRRLSKMVLHIQQRIETEVGRREPSVREMFRTASHLAARRSIMQRSGSGMGMGSKGGYGSASSPSVVQHQVQQAQQVPQALHRVHSQGRAASGAQQAERDSGEPHSADEQV